MVDKDLSEDVVKKRFDGPVDVSVVTRGVYEVADPDGSNLRYAKIWSEHNRSELEEFGSIDADIGMPSHRLIEGDPLILVMEPADGEMLNRALLKRLVPGAWILYRDRLVRTFRNLGRAIGRLHTSTHSHDQTLDPSSLSFDVYDAISGSQLASPLQDILDNSVVTRLEQQLTRMSEYEVPVSLVHGDLMLFHVYANSDGEVTLIDFDAAKRVPFVDDLIRFICALELFVRRLPYGREAQFEQLHLSFQNGYHETGVSYEIATDMWNTLLAIRHCSLLMYYHEKLPRYFATTDKHSHATQIRLRSLRKIDTVLLKRIIRNLVT